MDVNDICRAIAESVAEAVVVSDLDETIIYMNPAAEALVGFSMDEALGRKRADLLQDGAGPGEGKLKTHSGAMKDVLLSVAPLRNDQAVAGEILILQEVADKDQGEHESPEGERRFRELADLLPDIVYETDQGLKITYANRAAFEALGYSEDDLRAGMHIPDLLAPEESAQGQARLREIAVKGGTSVRTYKLRRKDGSFVSCEIHSAVITGPDGAFEGFRGVLRDVTKRNRIGEVIRVSRDTAWALLDASDDIAVLVDTDWKILGTNEALARAAGKPVQELVGTDALRHIPSENVAHELRAHADEVVATGKPVRFECQHGERSLAYSMSPVLDSSGHVTRMAVFARDTSDRKQLEASQRLAAIGQLAAGVAHEFNNLLGAVRLQAERAERLKADDQYEELTALVMRSTARGSEICRNLTVFAQPKEPARKPMRVEETIEAALALTVHQMKSAEVVVERNYRTRAKAIYGDAGQLEQVFLNLFINACHAMPIGGVVTIETRHVPEGDGPGEVVVKVSDTGTGIPPELLPHIFEPFFTTKGRLGDSDLPGTGLGLSVSHGIVSAHGGELSAHSDVGAGTTFELRFAACEAEVLEPEPEPQAAPSSSSELGSATRLLLAEDEPDLRQIIADSLSDIGYDVVATTSATEACRALRSSEFDLVITDLLMPGGGGHEVLTSAGALPDPPPVLVMTGRIEGHLAEELLASGASAYVQKPFALDDILGAIHDVLGGNGQD